MPPSTCLNVDAVVFYDKPWLKFERLLETYLGFAPRGIASFLTAMPVWLKEKLNLKSLLKRDLAAIGQCPVKALPPLLFTEHHLAHAASAFFPSPFERAGVLCLDGVGEWATTSLWRGEGNRLEPQWQIDFPHSLGLLYSAFTYYTGFKVNSGEYKLMGLAPYGEPRYASLIRDHLIDLKPDGTFRLDSSYFNYAAGLTMTNGKFDELFGGSPRLPEAALTQREMDLASSIQQVTEEVVMRLARTARKELGTGYLCLAGGVALNCVANGRLLRESGLRDIWVQPAAGDAGGAIGAALAAWHLRHDGPRTVSRGRSHERGVSRSSLLLTMKSAASSTRPVLSIIVATEAELLERTAHGACRWRGRRMVSGTHGIRPASLGESFDSWRSAQSEDAVGDESQDQVSRIVPPVRPGSAGGARQRLL